MGGLKNSKNRWFKIKTYKKNKWFNIYIYIYINIYIYIYIVYIYIYIYILYIYIYIYQLNYYEVQIKNKLKQGLWSGIWLSYIDRKIYIYIYRYI